MSHLLLLVCSLDLSVCLSFTTLHASQNYVDKPPSLLFTTTSDELIQLHENIKKGEISVQTHICMF